MTQNRESCYNIRWCAQPLSTLRSKVDAMEGQKLKIFTAVFSLLFLSRMVQAETVQLDDVIKKVKALDDAIDDETAKLVFRVVDASGGEKKSSHTLYWLNAKGKDGLVSKIMLFTAEPLNLRGEGYLVWEGEKYENSQAWIYLPDLRQTRKVEVSAHHDDKMGKMDMKGKGHEGHGGKPDEAESDLLFEEVTHKITGAGERKLIGEETMLGEPYVVIEQKADPSEVAATRKFWISTKNWTTRKIEYHDVKGELLKTQLIEWQQVNGVWLWKRTEVRIPHTPRKTVIELSDLKVNTGLDPGFFAERTLSSGKLP